MFGGEISNTWAGWGEGRLSYFRKVSLYIKGQEVQGGGQGGCMRGGLREGASPFCIWL